MHDRGEAADESVEDELNRYRDRVQVVFENAIQGPPTVLHRDFFSLSIRTAAIGYSHFVNAHSLLRNFCNYLWLKTETIFLNRDALDYLAAENLVASLHVRKVQIGE